MSKPGYIYILANRPNGVLYIGVTSDLKRRVFQHKKDEIEGFSKRYRLKDLVYFEAHDCIEGAIHREKQIKKWNRTWKVALINRENPYWDDLTPNL